ncbi:MAG: class I SAM-dependent methyltransferase [Actinomycetota bacterium]|nr:class I SAM-dependent methyltransferase [Actinomycetota bacterium]
MLTVDYDRLRISPGESVLDLGCGGGRHTFEALVRGATVTSVDIDGAVLKDVASMVTALRTEGEISKQVKSHCVNASALALPFANNSFDVVIASEVMEHITDDHAAFSELARVLRKGGRAAVTVPRWWPERLCWALSSQYHMQAGGHVRIYRRGELVGGLEASGLSVTDTHHAHALHSPYWWLKCAFGMKSQSRIPAIYHRFLVWDIEHPNRFVRRAERALNPALGKSLVVYAAKGP